VSGRGVLGKLVLFGSLLQMEMTGYDPPPVRDGPESVSALHDGVLGTPR
jgi:hypothetical protein